MTSKTITLTREDGRLDRFPEFPPREDMQNTTHLHLRSILTTLLIHFEEVEGTWCTGRFRWRRRSIPGEITGYPTLS